MSANQQNGEAGDEARICKRCSIQLSALVIRAEPLCKDCFVKYVHTKIIKRMESYRVRNAPGDGQRKLLLPISFGVSSTALLHVLDGHTQAQINRTGRAGFDLHVLHVSDVNDQTEAADMAVLKSHYPRHHYSEITLSEGLEGEIAHEPEKTTTSNGYEDNDINISSLLDSLQSPTSRADIFETARIRAIVNTAKDLECEAILWGHTTTVLAEKILAATAKGRGFSLPWLIREGESPYGVQVMHPMRDLLRKEVASYAELVSLPLSSRAEPKGTSNGPVSSKNTAIDTLMKDYFRSVEESYPSIVANVVRTSSKLGVPTGDAPQCRICMMPVKDSRFGTGGWGGSRDTIPISESDRFCYGCARSTAGMKVER